MKASIQQIQYVQQQYLQKTDQQISEKLGISKRTVAKIRKDLNLQRSEWTEKKLANGDDLPELEQKPGPDGQ